MSEERMAPKGLWRSATNWIESGGGSLENCLCFESSIATGAIEEEVGGKSKPAVLLTPLPPPSPPHSAAAAAAPPPPCEIKFSFEQSYEIRQVYVRSTARIYEIYYAIGPQSTNEYLCTVRCGIAAREDSTSDAINNAGIIREQVGGSTKPRELPEDKGRGDSNNGTEEDGWIEVMVSDSPLVDSETYSLAKTINTNTETSIQDFYEATAQITDANPCMSLTLRLLSLQPKEYVLIEDIYIFGEPAGPEQKVGPVENSVGSSLMAMLVPTLLQGIKRKEDGSDVRERLKHLCDESKGTDSLSHYNGRTMHGLPENEEINVVEGNKENVESTRQQYIEQNLHIGQGPEFHTRENDACYNRMERVLDQLVCRVGRIEAFCLRFEENMLRPLGNIEGRLHRLEHQLEVLTDRSQFPEFLPDARATVPKDSCSVSETNSLRTTGNEDGHYCRASEFPSMPNTKFPEIPCDKPESSASKSCGGLDSSQNTTQFSKASSANVGPSDSAVVPHLVPSLIVTVPEFLEDDEEGCGDADDCDDDSECAEMVRPTDKPSSLDGALASALAGFLSTSFLPPKVNQGSIIKHPESPDGDDITADQLTSPCARKQYERTTKSSCSSFENDGVELKGLSIDGPTEGIAEAVVRQDLLQEQVAEDGWENNSVTRNRHGITLTDDKSSEIDGPNGGYGFFEDNGVQLTGLSIEGPTEAIGKAVVGQQLVLQEAKEGREESNQGSASNGCVDQKLYVTDPANESREGAENKKSSSFTDFVEVGCDKSADASPIGDITAGNYNNYLETVLRGGSLISSVDFELPILNVEFAPQQNMNTECSLENLLSDMSDPCAEESNNNVTIGGQCELTAGPDFLMLGNLGLEAAAVASIKTEQIEDHFRCSDKEMLSLI